MTPAFSELVAPAGWARVDFISDLHLHAGAPATFEAWRRFMAHPKVELHVKDYGVITLELDEEKAPKSVANFLAYVNKGHYDGTVFHRVINGFMVQGGGMDAAMSQKPTDEPVENEANNGLKNDNYTVAMARTQAPHSATAQFFINVADNGFLNHTAPSMQGWGYAVFGKVVGGKDVVDKIKGVKTGRKGFHDDVPMQDVVIDKAVAV
jgi:peptidyl-prolyl cis-trans isomerase B (cyclophilin B)